MPAKLAETPRKCGNTDGIWALSELAKTGEKRERTGVINYILLHGTPASGALRVRDSAE
jgi:hypothetical protein